MVILFCFYEIKFLPEQFLTLNLSNAKNNYIKMMNLIPLDPTVREELLFQTGAPEFVVQKGELKALDGRCCNKANIINTRTNQKINTVFASNE